MKGQIPLKSVSAVIVNLCLVVGVAFVVAGCGPNVKPDQPDATPVVMAPIPASYVSLSMSAPLGAVQRLAEEKVPPKAEAAPYTVNFNDGADNCTKGVSMGYEVDRGPLQMSANGSTLTVGADISYWVEARAKVLPVLCGPLVYVSCGTNGEIPRTAKVQLSTTLNVQPNWEVIAHTVPAPVTTGNRCKLTIFQIDVTDHVKDAMQTVLNGFANTIDNDIRSVVQLKPQAVSAWNELSKPIKVADDVWLQVKPKAVTTSQLQGTADTLGLGVQLEAEPTIMIGPAPVATTTPLPDIETSTVGNTFNIVLPIYVTNEDASLQLRKALSLDKGPLFYPPVGSPSVQIKDVELFALGSKAVIKATLGGDIDGWLYLEAQPQYDALTQTLSFPKLDYSIKTGNLLAEVADWVIHSKLREDLRSRAVVSLHTHVDNGKAALLAAINRKAGAMQISGTVGQLGFLGLAADPANHRFAAQLMATGTLNGSVVP